MQLTLKIFTGIWGVGLLIAVFKFTYLALSKKIPNETVFMASLFKNEYTVVCDEAAHENETPRLLCLVVTAMTS